MKPLAELLNQRTWTDDEVLYVVRELELYRTALHEEPLIAHDVQVALGLTLTELVRGALAVYYTQFEGLKSVRRL